MAVIGIGMTGLLGWGDAYKAMHESDMLVLWGTAFPYFNFIPTKPEIVQIDRRGEVLGRRCRLDPVSYTHLSSIPPAAA